ncbi:MAG: hypothetical protein WC435_01675 [Candidatus Paceibacterota bacterium]
MLTERDRLVGFEGIHVKPEIFYPNMEKDANWTLEPITLVFILSVVEQDKEQLKRIDGETLAISKRQKSFPIGQILAQILIGAGEQIPDELADIPIYFPDIVWINKNEEVEKKMSPFIFCSCRRTKKWSMKYYDTKEYLPLEFAVVEEVFTSPI